MPQARWLEPIKTEVLLAFVFGTVFCGILAYASLSATPIAGPNFFFLKVLSALSAAGVAAVIPGMINLELGKGTIFAVRAAGAIAVFVLVFRADPPTLVVGDETLRAKMHANFAGGMLDDAWRQADEILRRKPSDYAALNIKGGIAFYNGDFKTAKLLFARAHQQDPQNTIITSNYANALVETGDYEKAIELFQLIDDGRPDRAFTLGRAYLYAGKFADANSTFERVPPSHWKGAGRVLQAASFIGMAREAHSAQEKNNLLQKARQSFAEGYAVEVNYWDGIFTGKSKDIHLTYDVPVSLLGSIYQDLTASKKP